jgi:hypothetical protein
MRFQLPAMQTRVIPASPLRPIRSADGAMIQERGGVALVSAWLVHGAHGNKAGRNPKNPDFFAIYASGR